MEVATALLKKARTYFLCLLYIIIESDVTHPFASVWSIYTSASTTEQFDSDLVPVSDVLSSNFRRGYEGTLKCTSNYSMTAVLVNIEEK